MRKLIISLILVLTFITVPLIFVGCGNNSDSTNISDGNDNKNEEIKDPVIEVSRKFKFDVYNNNENITYDFENNLITVKLSNNENLNVVHFKVSVLFDEKLDKNQMIYHTLTNSENIEVYNVLVNNYYLKFNKTGTFELKLVDYSAMLTKTITIVVE